MLGSPGLSPRRRQHSGSITICPLSTASSILPIFASDFDRPGSTRFSGAPHRRQGGGVGIVNAGRVTEAALTISDLSFGVQHAAITSLRDIEDDVVRVLRIAGDPADRTQVVEHQGVANPPGDHVIGAGGVAADADTAYFCTACRVEAQPAAEHVYTADAGSDHWIIRGAKQ